MSKNRIVFVHGQDSYGSAAWPAQHRLAGRYDCLFLRRTGFDALLPPVPTDFAADMDIVIEALGDGGHLVAHGQGAIAAMMAAVERADLIRSLTLVEPAVTSLTAQLPATQGFREHLEALFVRGEELSDADFAREYYRLTAVTGGIAVTGAVSARGGAARGGPTPSSATVLEAADRLVSRLRLQKPSWEAPLHIVPGVPTLVLTGGWEPLYEEIADYLAATGAKHVLSPGGHRPQDTPDGAGLIADFIAENSAPGLTNV